MRGNGYPPPNEGIRESPHYGGVNKRILPIPYPPKISIAPYANIMPKSGILQFG